MSDRREPARVPKPGDRIVLRGLRGDVVTETLAEVVRTEHASTALPAGIVCRTVIGDDLSESLTWVALYGTGWEPA